MDKAINYRSAKAWFKSWPSFLWGVFHPSPCSSLSVILSCAQKWPQNSNITCFLRVEEIDLEKLKYIVENSLQWWNIRKELTSLSRDIYAGLRQWVVVNQWPASDLLLSHDHCRPCFSRLGRHLSGFNLLLPGNRIMYLAATINENGHVINASLPARREQLTVGRGELLDGAGRNCTIPSLGGGG